MNMGQLNVRGRVGLLLGLDLWRRKWKSQLRSHLGVVAERVLKVGDQGGRCPEAQRQTCSHPPKQRQMDRRAQGRK